MRPMGAAGTHIPTAVPVDIPAVAEESVPPEAGEHEKSAWLSDTFKHTPHEWEDAKYWIVLLAIVLGLVSYICQWLFWGGLVKTWGPRYASIAAQKISTC